MSGSLIAPCVCASNAIASPTFVPSRTSWILPAAVGCARALSYATMARSASTVDWVDPNRPALHESARYRIAAYEVRGREVILYWRDMQPKQKISLPLSVVAAVPGTYTAPASRTYLYYTDEFKQWTPGMSVTITAK